MNKLSDTRRRIIKGAGAAALASSLPRAWSASPPVRVGVLLPTSGVFAASGQSSRRGLEFGAMINKELGGPAVELVFIDTESRSENGRVGAEKLIRSGCTVIIGAWDTGTTMSAIQASEAAKVPFMVFISSAPQITEQGFTHVFRTCAPAPALVTNSVLSIKQLVESEKSPPKTAVILYVNDSFGQVILSGFSEIWDKQHIPIKILDKIGYDVQAKDLSIEVAKAKATGADLVLPITRVNDAIMIVREMVKQNYSPMAIIGPSSPGPYERAFTDALGKYGDDYMDSVPWYNPRNPRVKALVERYEKADKANRFEFNVGSALEAFEVVIDAIRRAKSGSSDALFDALKTTNLEDHVMVGGPVRFDEKGQNPNVEVVMLQNRGGRPIVVGPKAIAEAAPLFPMRPFASR